MSIFQFLADTFYLPHNLDFRGRAYPIPPHLSHIGDDLSRGLLQFEEAKPLGVRGLRWLKIHLANLYGYDKANFDERVLWVEQHIADIYDSAEKPLEVSFFLLIIGVRLVRNISLNITHFTGTTMVDKSG